MKVLAIVLLCAFAAVQGRSAGVSNESKELAVLGQYPWFVHLRVALSTGGELRTCAGSVISPRWVLTAAFCIRNERFTWVRYGVINALQPALVLETSGSRSHPFDNLALVSAGRNVEFSDIISSVPFNGGVVPERTVFCGFGRNAAGGPGGNLNCFSVLLEETEENEIVATTLTGEAATQFDMGAPLVNDDGVQIALLQGAGSENAGIFFPITSDVVRWIESVTGIQSA